jgi:hypothetical protein
MPVVHRALFAAALLLPLGAMSAPPAPAAQTIPGSPEALAEAANSFARRLGELDKSGAGVGALKAPADLALLRNAFDAPTVRALPNDLMAVFRACQPVSQAYGALVAFASKPREGGQVGAQVLQVQDELVFATLATDLCAKRGLRAASPFVLGLGADQRDGRRNGIRMMQTGAQQILSGMLMIQSDPGISAANRAKILAGMLEDIDVVAEALSAGDRAKLRTEILGFADRADTVTKPKLQQVARAFQRTDCGTLCTFANG